MLNYGKVTNSFYLKSPSLICIALLLLSLPESYNPLITALDAVGEDTLNFQKVKGMLLNDADRISDAKKDEDAYTV